MKIAVLIDAWFPITGGGQIHVWQTSKRLVKKYNCQIEIITSRLELTKHNLNDFFNEEENLKITRLGPAFKFETLARRIIYLILTTLKLLSGNYDLIAAHAFLPAIPAKIARFFKNTPVVFTVHGISVNVWEKMTNKFTAKIFSRIEKLLLFQFKYDYQISVSSDFLKYQNVNQNIAVIGNGVDLKSFEKIRIGKAKPFKILFVGRLHPQKGLFYLIDAVEEVVKKYPQIYVVLVGEGPLEKSLKDYLKKKKLEKYFIFRGLLTNSALVSEYESSHLFVLPSVYEGFPLTLLEAWAAKLPVVATAVGEVPKLVKNGINGILIKPADVKSLANGIIFVIEDKEREKLGEKGAKLAKKFSWDKIAEKTYEVYRKVLNYV